MRGDRSKPAIVYKITNTINGHFYIGMTSRVDPNRRLNEHVSHANKRRPGNGGRFYKALRKYPKDAFVAVLLERHLTCTAALEAEIRLIAELSPEYNSTKGGVGRLGGGPNHLTPEGLAKISATSKLRKTMLGKKHSAKTRGRLREAGLEGIETFRKYAHLGPKAMARPVICIETGERFESISAAGRALGIEKSSIVEVCNGHNKYRKTAGGKRFRYDDRKDAA